MEWKALIVVFVLGIVLLSGCIDKFGNEADRNNGTAADENSADAPSDEIPTPTVPSGDESQPPNLPF